ncbi:MAG: xanthine dehydrogenase family protein [Candidatus Heimdallarchaeota archaeon]|nr:MAG: xanthine dehydrogenase family protein [Candidatus Heimdallarchaeota archaeon]
MVVGKPLPRKDARFKVKGEAQYIYDLSFSDEQFLAVVRSPHAHARIKKIEIDYERVKQLGATIGTAKDIPGKNIVHVILDDWPLLAEKVVRHVGEPVAIVVAKNLRDANAAVSAVHVEYEKLPAVFDPDEAKDHSNIHIFGDNNIISYWQQKRGDVNKGFQESDIIVEGEYRTPAQEHAYIEPQGCIAVPLGHDEITVYGSMQCPFYVQRAVSDILGYPWSKVTIVQTTTGGAFGGKEDQPNQLASLAALGAYLTKKPVKYLLTREEDIENTSKRHPAIIRVKTGVTKDGLLKAVQVEHLMNCGAYATLTPAVLYRGCLHAVGPYRCKNVDVQSYGIATNLVPFGAFRGFGSPQVLFACEEQMDRAAAQLGIDPSLFRERNLIQRGDTLSFGQKIEHSVGMLQTYRQAKEKSNWSKKWKPAPEFKQVIEESKKGKYLWEGIGISTIFYGVGLGSAGKALSRTGSYVQLEPDGSVLFAVGTTEIGQGMITVLSQIVAEELGVEYSKIRMAPVDTSRVPDSGPTVASRSTTFSGRALQHACEQIRVLMFEIISPHMETIPSDLQIKGNHIVSLSTDKKMVVEDSIKIMYQERGQVAFAGWDVAPPTDFNNKKGQGNPYVTYAWCTNIAEVEVDVQTGTVHAKNIWAAHDVGRAINPQTLEGQIEGGSLQGMGYGRFEEIIFTPEGEVQSNNLGTFLVPTTKDTPKIHSIIIEEPFQEGPYGAKGIGEQPLMGIAPAITNAIFNAIGVRISEIPATPERVWQAIQSKIQEELK